MATLRSVFTSALPRAGTTVSCALRSWREKSRGANKFGGKARASDVSVCARACARVAAAQAGGRVRRARAPGEVVSGRAG
jgi:hypothetical protein